MAGRALCRLAENSFACRFVSGCAPCRTPESAWLNKQAVSVVPDGGLWQISHESSKRDWHDCLEKSERSRPYLWFASSCRSPNMLHLACGIFFSLVKQSGHHGGGKNRASKTNSTHMSIRIRCDLWLDFKVELRRKGQPGGILILVTVIYNDNVSNEFGHGLWYSEIPNAFPSFRTLIVSKARRQNHHEPS